MNEAHSVEPGTTLIPRPSVAAIDLRRDSRLIYSPKYSDIVNPKEEKDRIKLPVSAVYKKVQQQRRKMMSSSSSNQSSVSKSASTTANNNNGEQVTTEPGDFKIGAVEDGKRSVRSISGLRRDSEIMYVPKYDDSNGKRTGLDSVFPNQDNRSKSISSGSSSLHPAGYPKTSDSGFSDDLAFQQHRSSIFERPVFGRLAFRNSITALGGNSMNPVGVAAVPQNKEGESTVDEAILLNHNRRQREDKWDQDDLESSDDEEENEQTPMYFFLAAFGLEEFIEPLVKEKFDLDSLMLVSEEDLISMKIPLGHRRKLMKAINDRKAAIENPDEMEDSHL